MVRRFTEQNWEHYNIKYHGYLVLVCQEKGIKPSIIKGLINALDEAFDKYHPINARKAYVDFMGKEERYKEYKRLQEPPF